MRAYHPRALSTTDTMAEIRHIKEGMYQLVWCDLPAGLASVPPCKMTPVLKEMALWIRTAKEAHKCCGYVSGPRSRIWQNVDIQGLLSDGIVCERRYAACRHGVRDPVARKWSPMDIHVFSTRPLAGAPCRCKSAGDHATWTESRPDRMGARRLRQVMLDACYQPLVPAIMRDTSSSTEAQTTAESAFPTEARLRAKEKEKAGHKAKKRHKFVEPATDDLGDDFKGLGPGLAYLMADAPPHAKPKHAPQELRRAGFVNHMVHHSFHGTGNLAQTCKGVYVSRTLTEALEHLEPEETGTTIWDISGGANGTVADHAY